MGPVPPATFDGGFSHAGKEGCPLPLGRCHRQLEKDRCGFLQRSDLHHGLIPRLDNYEEVEIMILARPLRGAEGMGAATVGPGHRNTTPVCEVQKRPRAKVYAESATVNVHRLWYGTRCAARDIWSPLHQVLTMKIGILHSPIISSSDAEPPQSTRKL